MNRGTKAFLYSKFVLEELLPHIHTSYSPIRFRNKYIAGFSLGGLMAFDMAMDYPMEFSASRRFQRIFLVAVERFERGICRRKRSNHARKN